MAIHKFIDYLLLEKKYAQHTVTAYQTDLNQFKTFCQENFNVNNIDNANYAVIRSWIVNLVEQGLTAKSVNRKISSLKAYYKFLLKTQTIKANPLAKHIPLKTTKNIQIPFSKEEVNTVLFKLPFTPDFEGVRDRLIIELFYSTGMRRSELIHLTINSIDLQSKTIKILGKRNKERVVPLLPSAIQLIEQYLPMRESVKKDEKNEWFFLTKTGNKMYPNLVYRIINHYFSKASSKAKKSPHIMRHTFATHLLNEGADLNSVKELLGHASLASTQVYTHNSIEELKKVYQKAHPRNK